MSAPRILSLALIVLVSSTPLAMADVLHVVPFDELDLAEGQEAFDITPWQLRRQIQTHPPYAVLDGPGEAYLDYRENEPGDDGDRRMPNLAVRIPEARDVSGRLFVPDPDGGAMRGVRFEIAAAREPADAADFHRAVAGHYDRLQLFDRTGAAWFRYRADRAMRLAEEAAPKSEDGETAENRDDTEGGVVPRRPRRSGELQETYELVTGGRALAENLQLDRDLRARDSAGEATVELASIRGITVREFDWSELTQGLEPELDSLARFIPDDQHAVFFPSFESLVTMIDEASEDATPVLHMFEPRVENAFTRERYEKQLALELTAAARTFGPQMIAEIAITGSDAYLRTGSDVAILLRTRTDAGLLEQWLRAKHASLAGGEGSAVETRSGETGGVPWFAVVSPSRDVCSYVARLESDLIVVTNSTVQLDRLTACAKGEIEPLAKSLEYRFLRDRYRLGADDETAFAMITDATIRRWCSPRWRIASARRIYAAAALSDLRASAIDPATDGVRITAGNLAGDAGEIIVGSSGVRSTRYGTLGFLTPIAELDFARVTPEEAEAYRNWRDGYENNWRFFDPIAMRFSIRDDRLDADVTAIPLIVGTQYREFARVVRGGKIQLDSVDRHPEALYQLVLAIDLDAPVFRSAEGFAGMVVPGVQSPLGWLGDSVSFYIDDDPIWAELAEAEDPQDFLESEFARLPIAWNAAVKSPLKLAAFLAGLRGFIQQSAPNLTTWETLEHEGTTFVKIWAVEDSGFAEGLEDLALCYVSLPDSFTVSLREDLVRRAIDRHRQKKAAANGQEEEGDAPAVTTFDGELFPLLGDSVAMHVRQKAMGLLRTMFDRGLASRLQRRSWSAIPILNEWQRVFGSGADFDPVAFHREAWGVELVCPGGGRYVWNDEWRTIESTVYGHPGEPREGPVLPPVVDTFTFGTFGLSFEHGGVRARARLERNPGD